MDNLTIDRFTTKENVKAELLGCVYCPEHNHCYSNISCNEIYNALSKLRYFEDLAEQGRLIILSIEDIHPCKHCDAGWGSFSLKDCKTCHDTCERLKQYNDKYSK